ncbi:hypothetical protein BGZ60DRAFT_532623 [Tricladium varicosporioides]|nr:hypothetical protein BGZ60DRAFT_532623 [Hymenoscyphus varicosporioides]
MAGYGKIADLMAKHAGIASFQRFDFLNTLNILFLQAELVHLEEELRESMREDLESGRNPDIPEQDDAESVDKNTNTNDRSTINDHRRSGPGIEPDIPSEMSNTNPDDKFESRSESENSERVESAKDWYVLANMENSSMTWDIMLKTREKLKEYDKAILHYTAMKKQSSPNPCDLKFLRRWFKEKTMGDFPLIGLDSQLWETSTPPKLIAPKARKAEDPLGSAFLSKVFVWWHYCIGHRIKKHVDEESQYFEYSDSRVLRAANIFSSIISSALLVGSVIALAFVDNVFVRLGIVAAFTQLFSLTLVLVTNARNVEMFAATAAFVAVQVVFVGSTYTRS